MKKKIIALRSIFISVTALWVVCIAFVKIIYASGIFKGDEVGGISRSLLDFTTVSLFDGEVPIYTFLLFSLVICAIGIIMMVENKTQLAFIIPVGFMIMMSLSVVAYSEFFAVVPEVLANEGFELRCDITNCPVLIFEWAAPIVLAVLLIYLCKISKYKKVDDITSMELSPDVVDKLKKYKELFDEGVLTEEEFTAKKKDLLDMQ